MKKFLTIMATTVLGTTAIANSNLIAQIPLNNKNTNKVVTNNLTDNTNPFIQKVNGIPSNSNIKSFAVAPNGTVYAGVNGNSLYYSTDGINFQKNNSVANKVNAIAVTSNGTVLTTSSDGDYYNRGSLYYSKDGINFQLASGFTIHNWINTIAVQRNGYIYAGVDGNHLYYSADGINFQQANLPGILDEETANTISFAPNGTVYVNDGYHLKYSKDGINFKFCWNNEIYLNDVTVAPNGTVYVGTGAQVGGKGHDGNGLWYSTDGINFQKDKGIGNYFSIDNVFVAPNGTVYAGVNGNSLYYSTDGINFQKNNSVANKVNTVYGASNGTVYVGTDNGLYYSADGINFQKNNSVANKVNTVYGASNGTVYVGTDNGLYYINLKNKLFSLNSKPNYFLNNQFVYDKPTNISISDTYLQNASLDGKSLTLPSKNLNLNVGKHTLTLTMKNEYKQYASYFGGDKNTGIINYNFWIKDTIADNQYSTNGDTTLYQGLVSNAGNTNGSNIIQTSSNQGSTHPADLIINLQDKLNNNLFLDLSKSYYVSGDVDKNNNFAGTGSKVYLNQSGLITNNQFKISTDGIYQLHLVDKVGNIQDTYLELGHSKDKDYDNWKLQGTFDDATFQSLAEELNVKPSVTGQDEAQQAMAWLNQYKSLADKTFTAEAKKYDAGFNITVADLSYSYKSFLDRTTVTDQGLTQKLNINELDNVIKEVVQNKINSGLNTVSSLTKKYNISTSNVIDSNSLNSYVSWINNYDSWFNKNKTSILTNEINKVSHGYASQSEIKNILANINISNIFNGVNYSLQTSTNYQEFINYQNLDQAILKVDSSQTWETQYQADLKIQESNLNLHGYTIAQILGNKQEPQTKSQMENYDNSGKSFHSWLQTEANSKYHKYQLDAGLEIGLPLFVLVSLISLTWYYRNTKKYKLFVFKRANIKNKEKVDD